MLGPGQIFRDMLAQQLEVVKRELTCSKFDLYFMRSYDEGLREEAPPGAGSAYFKAAA